MLAVGRLVGIEETIGDYVISPLTFYNMLDYFRYMTDRLTLEIGW